MEQLSGNTQEKRTSLSVGLVVYELLDVPGVREKVSQIYPVFAFKDAEAPFICYRRVALPGEHTKKAVKDTAQIEVYIIARTYEESVEIAEAVREALDGMSGQAECGLVLSRCWLVDADEDLQDESFIQTLIFNLEI